MSWVVLVTHSKLERTCAQAQYHCIGRSALRVRVCRQPLRFEILHKESIAPHSLEVLRPARAHITFVLLSIEYSIHVLVANLSKICDSYEVLAVVTSVELEGKVGAVRWPLLFPNAQRQQHRPYRSVVTRIKS